MLKNKTMILEKKASSYSGKYPQYDIQRNSEVKRRRVVILGATGSVGESALKVIKKHDDALELIGVAADRSSEKLGLIVDEFGVKDYTLYSREGLEGLERLATLPEADIVIVATTGTIALRPVLAALSAGKDVALANKETLVAGGHLVMAAAAASDGKIIPIDSEHNAIFQCLEGNRHHSQIKRLLLTSSGGPFRTTPPEELKNVGVEDALRHPNWSMGPKITVDSATMANKGLEVIEASWLFGVRPNQIDVVIHPQSIVHSMVEYCDNSILAQLSKPSMTFAIQHALFYPKREAGVYESLDFTQLLNLEFQPPDESRYPCLRLARGALEAGGIYPMAFNTANEIAVEAFLAGKLSFTAIPLLISGVLEGVEGKLPGDLDELIEVEEDIRDYSKGLLSSSSTLN